MTLPRHSIPVPRCSVVVCTRDRGEQLQRCLRSLARLEYSNFEVVVVDNAPGQPAERIAAQFGARYLLEPVPGLSRARNLGARASDAEILAFLDDDAVADPQWLAALAREFADPAVIAVTGRILPLSQETEAERLAAEFADYDSWRARRVIDRRCPNWFEMAAFGGIGSGTNMAVRRRGLEFWPGFDERLGRGEVLAGGEENLAFVQLLEHGDAVVYTPVAIVHHPNPKTLEALRARFLRDSTIAAAYTLMLLAEMTGYRGRLLRYVLGAFRSRPRPWRGAAPANVRLASRWSVLWSWLRGIPLYLRMRRAHTRPAPVGAPAPVLAADEVVRR